MRIHALAHRSLALGIVAAAAFLPAPLAAQQPVAGRADITGRVTDAKTGEPLPLVQVRVEGVQIGRTTDSAGVYRLPGVPSGPQVLRAQRIGYAPVRMAVTVPLSGALTQNLTMAASALQLEGVVVTADVIGRAQGELRPELGTASVIGREAIAEQPATTLGGVLSLIPGMPLQAPGLASTQQVSLRSAVTTSAASTDLAAFGTTIVLDGVPLSNNTNLQHAPAGVYGVSGEAGAGIDLRRLPASTIERVEVIRGVPSARYGDLTQGAVIVETRAGVIDPDASLQFDARSWDASLVAGRQVFRTQTVSANADVARYLVSPGVTDDQALRLTFQLAHRVAFGQERQGDPRLLLDTRLDISHLREDRQLRPEELTQYMTWNRQWMVRFSNRTRLRLGNRSRLQLTLSLDRESQQSYWQQDQTSGAMPFTDRLTPGQSVGHFIAGQYLARLTLDGVPWQAYGRIEAELHGGWLGFDHALLVGAELRREWNAGPGYNFDIAQPPQISFNGVEGFDRPRPFSQIPPLATWALYADDRLTRVIPGNMLLSVQAGARLDALNRGTSWTSSVRDALLEPRLNVELGIRPWLRLRGGWGQTAKLPSLDELYPAPSYYDLVNVNYYANDPAERLAVLTTFILDPTNPNLGFSKATKAEAGLEAEVGGAALSAVVYHERLTGGVGVQPEPGYLLRDHYQLQPGAPGTPPTLIQPPDYADTIPVLLQRRANNTTVSTDGVELTALLPEIHWLRTRFEIQGAWIQTQTNEGGFDVGGPTRFQDFQITPSQERIPYWDPAVHGGRTVIATYRIIHQQPQVGLVITAAIQHNIADRVWDQGGTDTLSFAGYMTRSGQLVPVPPDQRTDPQYADLRRQRTGLFVDERTTPADWLMSLQVAKTLPFNGRLSFWACNVLVRRGYFLEPMVEPRFYDSRRFGLELTLPLESFLGGAP